MYHAFLNDCVLCVGSNTWTEKMAQLQNEVGREWLLASQAHVVVMERMYVE